MDPKGSYLAHYLAYFGDRSDNVVDLVTYESDGVIEKEHIQFHEMPLGSVDPAEIAKYRHPCWCVPELIYADSNRGNEVWLHKRLQ